MKKNFNIAIFGLGQIGGYLLNELNIKKKDIELKTGKKIKLVAISAKSKNKIISSSRCNVSIDAAAQNATTRVGIFDGSTRSASLWETGFTGGGEFIVGENQYQRISCVDDDNSADRDEDESDGDVDEDGILGAGDDGL